MVALTKLAQKYQIKTLVDECERCLMFAHEIPVLDRLLLADQLQLKSVLVGLGRTSDGSIIHLSFQAYLTSMLGEEDWKELKANDTEKFNMLGGDFGWKMFLRKRV